MIDLLIHEPCNEPDFRSRHGGVRHTGFTGLCGPGRGLPPQVGIYGYLLGNLGYAL